MNKDKQRIAIAKILGWTPFAEHENPDFWFQPNERFKELSRTHRLPNFPGSLDAMHEAEKALTVEEDAAYREMLIEQNGKHGAITATAEERAGCFIRVKGKWETSA